MNVRRQVTGLLLLCLVACRHVDATTVPTAIPSKPTQVPQPTATSTQVPQPTATRTQVPQPTAEPTYEPWDARSPDKYWHAMKTILNRPGDLWFVSASGNCELRTTIPPDFGARSGLATWSPDSNRVAYFGYRGLYRVAPDKIMVIELDRSKCVVSANTVDLQGDMNGFQAIWAPDSSRLATVVDSRDIVILDQKAGVILTYSVPPTLTVDANPQVGILGWVGLDLEYEIFDLPSSPNDKPTNCMLSARPRCR